MKKIKLGDIATFKNGINFSKNESTHVYKCIGVTDFQKTILDNFNNASTISIDQNLTQEYFLRNNDIVLVRSNGNKQLIGRSMLVFPNSDIVTYSGFCIRCRVMNDSADVKYIFYSLQNALKQGLFAINQQTNINNINQTVLSNLEFYVPPIDTQRRIGNFLYALDEKIALNKKINATLEAMAKTLYMHEFFRKPPNGKLGDIVIENSKSIIPVGAAKLTGGEFPFFTSGDSVLSWTDSLVDGRNIFLNTGGNAGIKFHVGKAAYSTDTWCIEAENLTDYLYLLLKVIEPELDKKFFQGTGLKHLQKPLLKGRAIYIPTKTEREQFNAIVQPCFTKISANFRESRRLAEMRDWLLPMLMNGQIGCKEKI